jgi:hypothetical protein
MCVKNEVVDVVELLVLVVEVELVVVVLVLVEVVVVVVVEAGVVVAELVFVSVVVGTCCCTNGSLLWKLEYASAGETTMGCPLASASDSLVDPAVVATRAVRRVLGVASELPPPKPKHPESAMAHPATRMTPPRRCRYRCNLIFPVL